MALCVVVMPNGHLIASSTSETSCVTYILQSATEYHSQVGFFQGVTLPDAVDVSWMVFAVLAIAWGFKMLRRQF